MLTLRVLLLIFMTHIWGSSHSFNHSTCQTCQIFIDHFVTYQPVGLGANVEYRIKQIRSLPSWNLHSIVGDI